ncbi:flagellar basal body rod C-terminal domain-containing protein [Oscillospiraceae bacterium 38-13]
MSIGTFGSFTQARLAIYAAQAGLTVTGNNISNINTPGYTRQRVNQVSLYTAGSDRYYAEGDVRVGQGVLVNSISQIRSPYLDIRFRKENAKMGYMDGMLDGLDRIAMILDEVGKGDASKDEDGFGVLGLEFSKLHDALEQLVDQTGQQEYDGAVRAVASSLCAKIRSYASQLEREYNNTVSMLEDNVKKVNDLLDNIRNLNEEIRKCDVHGDNALELRDERNLAIDQLSELINIQVDYSVEEFSFGVEIEKLSIRLGNSNPDGSVETDSSLLIDGIYGSHINLDQVPEPRDPQELKDLQAKDTAKADKTIWPFIDANGNYTADAKDAAGNDNTANPDYAQYLKPDGSPTADPAEARQVNSPNYNMTITELRSKAGRLLFDISKAAEVAVTDAAELVEAAKAFTNGGDGSVTVRDAAGNITITNYRRAAQKNPNYDPKIPPYIGADGNPSFTPADPDNPQMNPAYQGKYIKEGGGFTDKFAEAQKDYYKTVITQTASKPVELDDNDLNGKIQAQRELLTEMGEFTDREIITNGVETGPYRNSDESAAGKRGIPYFQKMLDLLANKFASAMNEANQGFRMDPNGNYISPSVDPATGKPILDEETGLPVGKPITFDYTDAGGNAQTYTLNKNDAWDKIPQEVKDQMNGAASVEEYLKQPQTDANGNPIKDAEGNEIPIGIFDGGVLFSNNDAGDDPSNITASNINISKSWKDTTNGYLVRDFTCPPGTTEPVSGKSDNIRHLGYLLDTQKFDFIPNVLPDTGNASDEIMFNGTFFQMWNRIGSVLGSDQDHAGTMLDTHYTNALAIDQSRDSVSAVDFNDEAMNLMMYSKSYNAACRLMTTIDSVLDKLVNNTGITT